MIIKLLFFLYQADGQRHPQVQGRGLQHLEGRAILLREGDGNLVEEKQGQEVLCRQGLKSSKDMPRAPIHPTRKLT